MSDTTSILITGGAGFLGTAISGQLKDDDRFSRVVILSRDWHKHEALKEKLGNPEKFHWFLGDIRDKDRLLRAFNGIDWIIHAAANKNVPLGEYSPREILLDNCFGTQNVIDAAIDCGVKRVLLISSDKCVGSINCYGKSKALAESLIIAANAYSPQGTKFSVARYANVVGSSDSVIPLFKRQSASGQLTITDPRMSRLWITPEDAVNFILKCLDEMQGGEVFIPHMKSARIVDIAKQIAPEAELKSIGLRPGEKMHEILAAPEEMGRTRDIGWAYRIEPSFHYWSRDLSYMPSGSPVRDYALFTSASGPEMSRTELEMLLK